MEPEEIRRNENITSSSSLPTNEVPSLPGPSRYVPANRKRSNPSIDDFEARTLEALQEKENRHLSFFKGILPSLNNFTEIQTLRFQSKVINIITEMYGEQTQSTTLQACGYQPGQQYQSTPYSRQNQSPSRYQTGLQTQSPSGYQIGLQTQSLSGYQTGLQTQSPSPYQTAELETSQSPNTIINNITDDSLEEEYNFANT